jgi:hypothetical protein
MFAPRSSGLYRTASRESFGNISFKNCTRLTSSSGARLSRPVMLSPGCARLAYSPVPTPSWVATATIGIVRVACFTMLATVLLGATITSTLSRTSSAAISGMRSRLPAARRQTISRFCPSTYPSSRSPSTIPSIHGVRLLKAIYPDGRAFFTCCCALAVSGQAARSAAIPMNSRLRMAAPKDWPSADVRFGSQAV